MSDYFYITPKGKGMVGTGVSEGSTSQVLIALETMGSSGDIEDIAKNAHINRRRVKGLMPSLIRHGLVATVKKGLG